ncbi:Protein of unknown function [Tenacibaculum sp. MAR_2010_89]|uniref:DUF3179 domain-containing (seleno)protein n=1 Tax=Tenacibaculum sp. MAR_2010_89 TaxID=1250198 RepID=UPI000896E014|nr:DUF3179 domain-containing (seleno)protein [Tenacibaculum sp. MAR_2010_89]SED57928.1 Protein of unknown function [Tenacibaculum sp. MAR_2010_89]
MKYIFLLFIFAFMFSCSDGIDKNIDDNVNEDKWLVDETYIKEGAPFAFIDNPSFKKVNEIENVSDDDLVIMFNYKGRVKVFPYVYLNYSEVVNDKIDDLEYIASYCPQTKSGICFNKVIGGKSLNMFASGFLFKDNLVLTSQEEDVFWSQMLLTGIKGSQKYMEINDLFSIETTWKTIKDYFPMAQVYYHNLLSRGEVNKYNSVKKAKSTKFFGIVNGGIENSVEVFPYSSFSKLKLNKLIVNGRQTIVIGDESKNIFTSFYEPTGENLELDTSFPLVLKDNKGNRWNIFGEAIEGPKKGTKLASPSFFHAELWAWNFFYKNNVTMHN